MISLSIQRITEHVVQRREREIARALNRVLPVGVTFDKIPPHLKQELQMIHRHDGGLDLKFGDVRILIMDPPAVVMDNSGEDPRWFLEVPAKHFTINGDEISATRKPSEEDS